VFGASRPSNLADELGLSRMFTPPLAVTRADLPGARPAGVGVAVGATVGGRVGTGVAVGAATAGRVAVAAARAGGEGDAAGVTRI